MGLLDAHLVCYCVQLCTLRLTYAGPGILRKFCYGKDKAYAELGSKFKAAHVKSLQWWLALRSQKATLQVPGVSQLKFSAC